MKFKKQKTKLVDQPWPREEEERWKGSEDREYSIRTGECVCKSEVQEGALFFELIATEAFIAAQI